MARTGVRHASLKAAPVRRPLAAAARKRLADCGIVGSCAGSYGRSRRVGLDSATTPSRRNQTAFERAKLPLRDYVPFAPSSAQGRKGRGTLCSRRRRGTEVHDFVGIGVVCLDAARVKPKRLESCHARTVAASTPEDLDHLPVAIRVVSSGAFEAHTFIAFQAHETYVRVVRFESFIGVFAGSKPLALDEPREPVLSWMGGRAGWVVSCGAKLRRQVAARAPRSSGLDETSAGSTFV